MIEKDPQPGRAVDAFIQESIDSVPHLEALMLLWNSRPVGWSSEELGSRLYLQADKVHELLRDLVRLQLVAEVRSAQVKFSYLPGSPEQDAMLLRLDEAYRRDLVRISNMIHSKTPPAVREFARAFRFKKEREP